jgi:DNA polymerase (family 10)
VTERELDNEAIARRLADYGALLELAGAGYYSQRAYRRAAELVRATPAPIAELARTGRVRELRGIGPAIEARLRELVETGDIAELAELERSISLELAAFGRLLGIGAARAVEIGQSLGIRTAEELRAAAAEGRLREVRGIGPKLEAKIRAALERGASQAPRGLLLSRARALVEAIAAALGGVAAGDARRWTDMPARLAVVVPAEDAAAVRERFASLPEIVAVVGDSVGVTLDGAAVELVVCRPAELGTALVRATGSHEFVAALEPLPVARDEEDVFRRLRRPFVPPELREGAPGAGDVPRLVEVADVRGDLHVHTTGSDGRASVLEMATAARDRGYEYLAICDHTPSVAVVPGLDADGLRRQAEEVASANDALAPFRVLRGAECDIRRDGSLDLPDDVLAELEWVQLSLHAGQRTPRRELTKRVTEAMRHPAVRCLSHPTGRLIGHRPENALGLDETFAVARETGVALEVNGLPDRLDLRGEHVRRAIEAGVSIVCSTDAHSVAGLGNMPLSVHTARRGRATAADVLNTRPWIDLRERGQPVPGRREDG